jgi:hypothetical protein
MRPTVASLKAGYVPLDQRGQRDGPAVRLAAVPLRVGCAHPRLSAMAVQITAQLRADTVPFASVNTEACAQCARFLARLPQQAHLGGGVTAAAAPS